MTKKRRKANKYLPNMVTEYIGGIPFVLKLMPATASMTALREMRHCRVGVAGESCTCANSEAFIEHVLNTTGKRELWIFTDSRAYQIHKFVKRRGGVYGLATVYEHKQGPIQRRFDEDKVGFLKSDEAVSEVTVYPYTSHLRAHGNHGSGKGGARKTKNTHPAAPKTARLVPLRQTEAQRRGSLRRAQRAGILAGIADLPAR